MPTCFKRLLALVLCSFSMVPVLAAEFTEQELLDLLGKVIDQTRGIGSYSELRMEIHRPSWQRTSEFVAWTRGRDDALIRFTAPARDAGNAILKTAAVMWAFSPKVNRAIRLPSSMMSQDWAGSDFTYNDLARSDELVRYYTVQLADQRTENDHEIYVIDAIPHDDAPVVWGKETVEVRDDFVVLKQTFFDQEMAPVKVMQTLDIGEMGGRVIPTRMRITKVENPEYWTEVTFLEADFDAEIEDSRFTQFALRSQR